MKRLFLILSITMLLTSCGLFDRGNYEKNRSGFVIKDDLVIKYHTNSVGEIDIFMIDQLMTYFEALEYTSFDETQLSETELIDNIVSVDELQSCGITHDYAIPKYIKINQNTYFYHIRDNGYCTYDQYIFHENGYSDEVVIDPETTSPLEITNTQRFKDADFRINPFEETLLILNISYNSINDAWEEEVLTVLPMSYTQAGDNYELLSNTMDEISVIETYVLQNQSTNLLQLRDDYLDEDVNTIWADATIDALGRDHELIKKVRIKKTGDILDAIYDTLSGLGMFQ